MKKKRKPGSSRHLPGTFRSDPMLHYRLNLAEIPFVAGQVTTGQFFSIKCSNSEFYRFQSAASPYN